MSDASQRLLRRFLRNDRGNIAVIFSLALLPLLSAVGAAVDYSMATKVRAKLLTSADAASVGSVARNSPGYIAAGNMTGDGTVSAGVTDAINIFNGNLTGQTGFTEKIVTATVAKNNGVLTSTVSFTANVPTTFMGLVGKSTLTVTGTSVSTSSMPAYIDFYLLLDNSPSMGVGATPTDVDKMVKNTSDKCAFACHDLSDENNYYKLAKKLGVTTRIDVLRSATEQLMDNAAATAIYPNQFRMAIYDFGASASTAALRSLFALSSSLSSAKTAAGKIDLMTVAKQNELDDQDTNYTKVLPAIDKEIGTPGSGISSAPKKYLFFVSDGVADEKNAACLKKHLRHRALPVADQPGIVHRAEGPRRQDRRALHHLSRPADQRLVQVVDRTVQRWPLRALAEQRNRQQHEGVCVAGLLFRGQPDGGHLGRDEYAVSEGDHRRPDRELSGPARLQLRGLQVRIPPGSPGLRLLGAGL